ncbi:hypothetical protein EDC04DRAFT_2617450 [Pisolithus marmoratus]|nr:hypothetical protein EDC04DRAFT_2617450 [Pisolithus marmoratus]
MSNSSEGDSSWTANGQEACFVPDNTRSSSSSQSPFWMSCTCFLQCTTLLTNGIILLSKGGGDTLESLTVDERKELWPFRELLRVSRDWNCDLWPHPRRGREIGELIQKGINGARADDTKGMKGAIIDWITPKGLDWTNIHISILEVMPENRTRTKLMNGEIQVPGDQWLVFLYADYNPMIWKTHGMVYSTVVFWSLSGTKKPLILATCTYTAGVA